jgi:hypothetical protein
VQTPTKFYLVIDLKTAKRYSTQDPVNAAG